MTTTLTPDLLSQIMQCPPDRAVECFPAMASAMHQFGITSPARITCFFAQVKWESGGFVYFAELASGDAYNGRSDLGNTQPGDGPRYKGSGPIQVTGRDNFTQAQQALDAAGINIDIVANPDLARTVQYGFWISCWWWQAHGGNQVAERQPLSYASLCCGRLVNRGDADSQYQAQDEQSRIDAFNHVSGFGDLALPGSGSTAQPPPHVPSPAASNTPPPPPKDWYDMATQQDLTAAVNTALAPVKSELDQVKTALVATKTELDAVKSGQDAIGAGVREIVQWMADPKKGFAARIGEMANKQGFA